MSGFGVAAYPSGAKVYVAQYRQGGRSRRSRLGEHGRLTPEQARSEAKKVLGRVEQGADPIAERRAERGVPAFEELAQRYLDEHVKATQKARTLESYESLLRLHVAPAIGRSRITDICRADVLKLHRGMADHPIRANRALALISSVWNWAAREHEGGAFPANPTKGVQKHREEGRERYLTTEELGRLGDALVLAETDGLPYLVDEAGPNAKHAPKPESRRRRLDPFAVAAVRLLILTGARLREVLHARWDEIDFERGLLNLPGARSKTGKKSVFLSAAALEVLAGLPTIEGSPYVFPGSGTTEDGTRKPRADLNKPWAAIIEAAALPGLRLHDLRHSFASVGAGQALGLPVIGKLLGHRNPATTAKYAHLDATPLRLAADSIGAQITAAMARRPAADVVPIRKPAS